MILAAVVFGGWYAFGVFSHVFWWTKKHDYTTGDIGLSIISGFLGPINWWVGWVVCGDGISGPTRVLMPRRHPQSPQEKADG